MAWVDGLRWVAAAAVVMQHSLAPLLAVGQTAGGSGLSTAWLINSLLRFPVPVFFFLSGYLGSRRPRALEVRVKRSLARTALPYIAWSATYTLLWLRMGFVQLPNAQSLLTHVLTAREGPHLWFLASLTVIAPVAGYFWDRWGARAAFAAVALGLVTGGWYSYSMVWHSPVATLVRMGTVPLGLWMAGALYAHRDKANCGCSHDCARIFGLLGVVFLLLGSLEAAFAELLLSPHWSVGQQDYPTLLIGSVLVSMAACEAQPGWISRLLGRLGRLPGVTLGVYCIHPMVLLLVATMTPGSAGLVAQLSKGAVAVLMASLVAWAMSRSRILRRLVM